MLPAFDFEPLGGWLAFATVEQDRGREYWSPSRPGAEVLHFSSAWTEVPQGTRVVAATSSGEVMLTYSGTEEIRYGCEENTQAVAVFDSESPVAEGPVWIMPPPPTRGALVLPIASDPVQIGAQRRTWRIDGLELIAVKSGARVGELKVMLGGALLESRTFEKPEMAGADERLLELADEDEVGLLKPLQAWRLRADGTVVIVLGRRSYEGHQFEVVAVRDGKLLKSEGSVGLYFCAF